MQNKEQIISVMQWILFEHREIRHWRSASRIFLLSLPERRVFLENAQWLTNLNRSRSDLTIIELSYIDAKQRLDSVHISFDPIAK